MKLREYQERGADFFYEHDFAMMQAPVGAGKTATALVAMRDVLREGLARRFLVLAPKRVAQSVWPKEAALWAPELSVAICQGTPAQRAKILASGAQVVAVNYDVLQWLVQQDLTSFDGLLCDELTRLKDPSGKRCRSLLKILHQFRFRWGLTGSFTSNGLKFVFGQCRVIDPTLLGTHITPFLREFFYLANPTYNLWEPLPGALERVLDRIRPATFPLEPGQYTDTLPPLHIVEVKCQTDLTLHRKMRQELVINLQGTEISAINAAVATNKLLQLASGFAYHTVKTPRADAPGKFHVEQTAVWNSPHKFDALDDLLSENQYANTLVFYEFEAQLQQLLQRYPHLRQLSDAPDIIEQWNAGKIQLLAMHPKSAAHGLNLQHGGCHVVFLTPPWSWEIFEQGVGRLHRSGQRHPVWCYLMLTEGTDDERAWAVVQGKRDLSTLALDLLKNSATEAPSEGATEAPPEAA